MILAAFRWHTGPDGCSSAQPEPEEPRGVFGSADFRRGGYIRVGRSAADVVENMGSLPFRLWKIDDPCGGDLTEYERAAIEIKRRLIRLKASGLGGDEG